MHDTCVIIGTSISNVSKLQRVQNCLALPCLARVVLQDSYSSATSLLSELHWLSASKRINFKIATLAYVLQVTCFWSAQLGLCLRY